jgi:hypothetical protein
MGNGSRKKVAARTVLVFLSAFLIALFIWIPIKGKYGGVTTFIASKFAAGLKDAKVVEVRAEKDVVLVTFTPLRSRASMLVDIRYPYQRIPLTRRSRPGSWQPSTLSSEEG